MRFVWLAVFLITATSAAAFQNEAQLKNRVQEERAQALFKNIRCMVCTGESLAESNAELAVDMRKLIRAKISEGESDDEIKNYLTSRYGQQILQDPPFNGSTLLLWLMPLLIFFGGGIFILKTTRSKYFFNRHKNV